MPVNAETDSIKKMTVINNLKKQLFLFKIKNILNLTVITILR